MLECRGLFLVLIFSFFDIFPFFHFFFNFPQFFPIFCFRFVFFTLVVSIKWRQGITLFIFTVIFPLIVAGILYWYVGMLRHTVLAVISAWFFILILFFRLVLFLIVLSIFFFQSTSLVLRCLFYFFILCPILISVLVFIYSLTSCPDLVSISFSVLFLVLFSIFSSTSPLPTSMKGRQQAKSQHYIYYGLLWLYIMFSSNQSRGFYYTNIHIII